MRYGQGGGLDAALLTVRMRAAERFAAGDKTIGTALLDAVGSEVYRLQGDVAHGHHRVKGCTRPTPDRVRPDDRTVEDPLSPVSPGENSMSAPARWPLAQEVPPGDPGALVIR